MKATIQTGTIVKVKRECGSLVIYILDNGTEWSDTEGKWSVGTLVRVTPYIMGTVVVSKVE